MRSIVVALLLFMSTGAMADAVDISLYSVDGLAPPDNDRLICGSPVTFYLRVQNNLTRNVAAVSNTFRVWSPDGASFRPHMYIDTTLDLFPPPVQTLYDTTWYGRFEPLSDSNMSWTIVWCSFLSPVFDLGISVIAFPLTGGGADTVVFSGLEGNDGTGLSPYFDEVAWSISVESIDCPALGDWVTLCLDSVNVFSEQDWIWSNSNDGLEYEPTWNGPYCFEIHGDFDGDGVADDRDNCPITYNPQQEDKDSDGVGDSCSGCCTGITGNFDGDSDDVIDIIDLTYLVAFMFKAGDPPPCEEECDVNGQPASLDILDLTYLVDYMFKQGAPPLPCSH